MPVNPLTASIQTGILRYGGRITNEEYSANKYGNQYGEHRSQAPMKTALGLPGRELAIKVGPEGRGVPRLSHAAIRLSPRRNLVGS